MLADFEPTATHSGSLGSHVHLPDTSLQRLLDFLTNEVISWRDDPVRPSRTSETALTDSL